MPKFNFSNLKNKHFLALAGNGVISVFTVLQMALIYHKLEKNDVGTWVLFLTIIGIAESIRNGFLSTATIKFYAGTVPKRASEVLGSIWYLALAITGLLVLLDIGVIGVLKYINQIQWQITIKWFGITFISSLPYTLITWILMADERYDKILWLRMVNNGSMIITLCIIILANKMSLNALLWINFLTNMLTNLVGFVFGMTKIKTIIYRSKTCMLDIFHFGKFSLGTNLVSNLLRNTDIFFINAMLGPAAVAIYNIPTKLMEIVEIPLRSFVGTGMSGMAAAYNNNNTERIKFILTKYAGMLLIAFIPLSIIACLFSNFAINLIGGAKYAGSEAVVLFRVLMVLSIFAPIDRFNGATLDVIHKPKINFYKVIIMLITNILADFIGLYYFNNLYGILLGSVFTLAAGISYGYFELRKYINYTISEIVLTGIYEAKLLIDKAVSFIKK